MGDWSWNDDTSGLELENTSANNLTFFQKKAMTCPVCDDLVRREEMRSGRGRMIAGNLTVELRRNYEPSAKYGEVYPLIYPVVVCPSCYFASFREDFSKFPERAIDALKEQTGDRQQQIRELLGFLDFTQPRGLVEGLASYLLAISCYDQGPKELSPLVKQGISCLRAAWLAMDLYKKHPGENYEQLAAKLYRKARYFYSYAIENEQNGKQSMAGCPHLGPDLDQNYMYDGVLYISGYLEYKYGPQSDPDYRRTMLEKAKRTVARIFGMGRASKNKPQAILDNARDLYTTISEQLGLGNQDPDKAAAEDAKADI